MQTHFPYFYIKKNWAKKKGKCIAFIINLKHEYARTDMASQRNQLFYNNGSQQQAGEANVNNNIVDGRKVLLKKDVIQGLLRTQGLDIPPCDYAAPLFAIAFDMADKTAVPVLARRAIWLINNGYACIHKGEEGAFIRGIVGLECLMSEKRHVEKAILQREIRQELKLLKEMHIQLRIHVAQSEDGTKMEHYAVLLVASPLAFSLRKAVWMTLHTKGRGLDSLDAEQRRVWWNQLATHVKQGFAPIERGEEGAMSSLYTADELAQAHDTSVDWIRVHDGMSFTRLFNVHRTVEWITKHFFNKYAATNRMVLEGFGTFERDGALVDPAFWDGCKKYDIDIDRAISKTYEKKKKGSKKRARPRGSQVNDEEEEDEEQDNNQEEEVLITKPHPFRRVGADVVEYPACDICMDVHMPKSVEFYPPFDAFWSNCRGFPTSVTLDILKKMLHLDVGNEEPGDCLTMLESASIIRGEDKVMKRPLLSGGDVFWGRQCRQSVLGVAPEQRFEYQKKIMKLSLALGLTRAGGSDIYENKRVESYGKFMMSFPQESVRECKECYDVLTRTALRNGTRLSCCVHEATTMFTHVMYECNAKEWTFRPDNLFLFVQMHISDVMLALNFQESSIDGASNGIGATLVIRDGGGNYRVFAYKDLNPAMLNELANGGTQVAMLALYSKGNGSGADMLVQRYRLMASPKAYTDHCTVGSENFEEIKKTSEMGMLMGCCNVFEKPMNGPTVQVNTIKDVSMRQYSTELKAGDDPASLCCMQAISWLIQRNTTGTDMQKFVTTKENEKTKGRTTVEYQQVIYGYWLLCSNEVKRLSRERMKTILAVTRTIASAADGLPSNDSAEGHLLCVPVSGSIDVKPIARPLFFANMGTAVVAAFLQWTGVLGKLPASPILETIIESFYSELAQCQDMLNPDTFRQGASARCLEVSKARGVALSLIMTSMEQTLEAGRTGRGQDEAVEVFCLLPCFLCRRPKCQ